MDKVKKGYDKCGPQVNYWCWAPIVDYNVNSPAAILATCAANCCINGFEKTKL